MTPVVLRPGFKEALSPYARGFAWLARNPTGRIKTWWGCAGLDAEGFRRLFHEKLEERIHRCDPRAPKGRKTTPEYQLALRRDQGIIHAHAGYERRFIDPDFPADMSGLQFGRRPTCKEIRRRFRDLLIRAYDPELDRGPLHN